MFGLNKKIHTLQRQVRILELRLAEQQEQFETSLQITRTQLASVLRGVAIPHDAILCGRSYAEMSAADLESAIASTPELLILDIRNDANWDRAHVAAAKHIPAEQVFGRLAELPDRDRPLLLVSGNGDQAIPICDRLAKSGYANLYNLAGGMAAYTGPVVTSAIAATDLAAVRGVDRTLIEKVAQLLDADVRPGLVRDGGDLQLIAIENGVVQVRMVGACLGCGSQKKTVNQGIRTYLTHMVPEIREIEDLTGGNLE